MSHRDKQIALQAKYLEALIALFIRHPTPNHYKCIVATMDDYSRIFEQG